MAGVRKGVRWEIVVVVLLGQGAEKGVLALGSRLVFS